MILKAGQVSLVSWRAVYEGDTVALDEAVDRLNGRYGRNSVYFGGAQAALDAAPTRIAFTHVPKVEKEREEIPEQPGRRKRRRVKLAD